MIPISVTVTNNGTASTGELSVTIEGTNAAAFTCKPSTITIIEPEETDEFTVVPVSGLKEGTYTAEVRVKRADETIGCLEVNFKVNKAGGTGGGGSTSPSPLTEEGPKSEISDNKKRETIDIKTDEKKGTALVELKDNKALSGKDIVVKMPRIKGIINNILSVPVEKLSKIAKEGSITFETHYAGIVLSSNLLTQLEKFKGKKAELSVAEAKKADLPKTARIRVGDKPLVSFNLSIDKAPFSWKGKGAALRLSIPYTPEEGELKNLDGITANFIDEGGNLIEMEDASYEPKTKSVVFTAYQFGHYAVGYKEDTAAEKEDLQFSDVGSGDWYYDAVKFLLSKNITNGMGDNKFAPKSTLNRAQFVVMLMRSYGLDPDEEGADNFADAGNSYYTNYLAAAKRLGIAKGVGGNKFAPEAEISREAMFTLLYNALKVLDKLPRVDSVKSLSDFDDGAEVSDWAREALTEMVKNGAVAGINGRIRPAEGSNRAELESYLYTLWIKEELREEIERRVRD